MKEGSMVQNWGRAKVMSVSNVGFLEESHSEMELREIKNQAKTESLVKFRQSKLSRQCIFTGLAGMLLCAVEMFTGNLYLIPLAVLAVFGSYIYLCFAFQQKKKDFKDEYVRLLDESYSRKRFG